jgi:hypothetical protein
MMSRKRTPLSSYRQRLKRRGVIRLEVHVRKDDAALVRGVMKALADPGAGRRSPRLAARALWSRQAEGLKALLASAPLEGIDLGRDRDFGRDVRL